MAKKSKRKVLLIFANPRTTSSLRLGEEDRAVTEAIQLAPNRDSLEIVKLHAATIDDVHRAVLREKPEVVHVSGHGTQAGLVLETQTGSVYVVPQNALAELFAKHAPPRGMLQCVILNACYSISQGRLASVGVEHTIAMEGPISDVAAIEFARGFYDAAGAGYEYDQAYEEGCIRVKLKTPSSRWKTCLLRKGEVCQAEGPIGDDIPQTGRSGDVASSNRILLGVAVDLSGSMRSHIQNRDATTLSRFEAFRRSLDSMISGAEEKLRASEQAGIQSRLETFVYGFGLRLLPYCDLLSMLQVIESEEVKRAAEAVKNRIVNRAQQRYSGYGDLANLASRYGFGGYVEAAKASAESQVREQIFGELRPLLENNLQQVGDTTVGLSDLASRWRRSGTSFKEAEQVLYGDTPMCAALRAIVQRFERELRARGRDIMPILFLLSDGEPTDGDPLPLATPLGSMNVSVVSCFVGGHDTANPRILFGQEQSHWDSGGRKMFRLASPVVDDSDFARFLLHHGWEIHPNARLFVQVNHSDVLREFMNVVLSPLDSGYSSALPPPGL